MNTFACKSSKHTLNEQRPVWSEQIRRETARLLTRALQLCVRKEHVERDASSGDKRNMINPWTYVRFREATQNKQDVTTRRTAQWELATSIQLTSTDFHIRASAGWV
jgi:hypothetical protein